MKRTILKKSIGVALCCGVLILSSGCGVHTTPQSSTQDSMQSSEKVTVAETNSVTENNTENSQEAKGMEEQKLSTQGSEEVQNLRQIMEDFCQAYFRGDTETVKGYLSASYSDDLDVYENPEEVENMDMRDITGLDGISELDAEKYNLSKPFVVSGEDSLTYLSVTFVLENGEWKVSYYGLEK